ncbi:Nitrogen assimilation transcription factor nirA [Lecanosticta acicola]|uniref:Nitrogen assimilation transcription factor nirA n=1 Tax=Lecanosticta acicola TaxID=111012 RepID=A0AAI9EDC2_9PEZI|nr:Nitrogen assimilation transcription factor nirA [Lecanosticta acicola]
MSTLTDRVALLESMLKEKGAELPPVVYPPKTTRGSLYADGDDWPAGQAAQQQQSQFQQPEQAKRSPRNQSAITEGLTPPSARDESVEQSEFGSSASVTSQRDQSEQNNNIGTPIDDKKDGLVSRLLSTRGHLSFDQLSGRLRFYGGTVNCHVYSELEVDDGKSRRESHEQARRAEKCVRTLPLETHDYLMDRFWQHYNSVLHVVHEEAFNEDRENGRAQSYSGFLHVCILAMGYRFADKSRPDMQRIGLPDRESTIHREARYMLDLELERPGGIPSIAALLILGDSEVGVGRDNVGWMYSGMAIRLCYDLGLQLDSRQAGLSQRELDIRKMTLWACVIYDRYWSLFLGRPLTMKSVDLEIYSLSDQFERLGTCMPAGAAASLNTRIYEALLELMEIAGKIVEHAEFRKQHDIANGPDQQAYFKMAALDRELHTWISRLPLDLRYTERNKESAPLSFFLLHQQYHAVLILLHRPFARYGDSSTESDEVSALDSHFSQASRAICTKSAVSMARIFWQHRQKFDGKQMFCIGMQHAGAAATALIAALAHITDATDRNNNMQYLEVLHAALQDMAHAYEPAERMAAVLNACMIELRGGPISPGNNTTIPARRGNGVHDPERTTTKRRQTDRASTHSRQMQPPAPTSSRQHRASDASVQSQQLQSSAGDYVMVTPRTEQWPHASQHMLPTPDTAGMSSPERRQEWISQLGHGFPQVSPMTGVPGIPDGDVSSLEFLSLPSEDDWARWHSLPGAEAGTDLDGFPPRERLQPNNFATPPMGGIMNG